MKHTPGPWCVESAMGEDTDIALAYEIPSEGSPIIIATCFPGDKTEEDDGDAITYKQARANAKLMAAAPDMLAALRVADDAICQATWEVRQKELTNASNIVRAAIAKAEGLQK